MLQNFFDDIDKQESYTPTTEPVSLAEAKSHCLISHSEDDDYLTNILIPACREVLEDYCHISLVEKVVTATLRIENNISTRFSAAYRSPEDQDNVIELPYGPIKEMTSVTRVCGGLVTALTDEQDYNLTGTAFKQISLNSTGAFLLIYKTGYQNTIPRDLKLAILNEIAYRYEKRGDEGRKYLADQPGVCPAAQILAEKHRRIAWH